MRRKDSKPLVLSRMFKVLQHYSYSSLAFYSHLQPYKGSMYGQLMFGKLIRDPFKGSVHYEPDAEFELNPEKCIKLAKPLYGL